jgi:hypothetical protein
VANTTGNEQQLGACLYAFVAQADSAGAHFTGPVGQDQFTHIGPGKPANLPGAASTNHADAIPGEIKGCCSVHRFARQLP